MYSGLSNERTGTISNVFPKGKVLIGGGKFIKCETFILLAFYEAIFAK